MTTSSDYRPPGARYEIRVAGVPRTYRDRKEIAIEAARQLELRDPDVTLVDLADGAEVAFPVTLRFVRTIDVRPHMFSRGAAAEAADDWLLRCGPWTVGRIQRPGDSRRNVLVWSLTGPIAPQAPVAMRGEAAALADGKAALVASFRAVAAWAGIAPEGTAAPRWAAGERADEWLLMSGALDVGRVLRPQSGPRRDPHWALGILTAATPAPFAQAGWADDVDAAKARLSVAWDAFLAWAELPAVAPRA